MSHLSFGLELDHGQHYGPRAGPWYGGSESESPSAQGGFERQIFGLNEQISGRGADDLPGVKSFNPTHRGNFMRNTIVIDAFDMGLGRTP